MKKYIKNLLRESLLIESIKKEYIGQCDILRRNCTGEDNWQEMMEKKEEIPFNTFFNNVDMSNLLDDGETSENFHQDNLRSDPDTNPELIDMGDKYLLKVNKYPDKLIWFTDDKNFAEKYNGWGLIIYDLPVINHKKIVKYEDGHQDIKFTRSNSVESGFGGVISADPGRNSHFYRGIELPNHWYWSYKGQKHIVCDADLLIPKDSVIRLNKI